MTSDQQHGDDAAQFDALAQDGPPQRAFLRSRWFDASPAPPDRIVLRGEEGMALAALGLAMRRRGPFRLREIAGSYWPFRGVPLAPGIDEAVLADALGRQRKRLGSIWRLGPVEAGDPELKRLRLALRQAGWHALARPLGQVFEIDLAALRQDGAWPSTKTQRKNRWRKRRLEEEGGAVSVEFFSGSDWTARQRDALAQIEAESWLGTLADGGDTKFRDPEMRRYWEDICTDPVLAAMLFGSLMWIGDTPAAFTFGIEAGPVRYYIANNYDQRFNQFGAGRVLLYDDFARAGERGVRRISWGVGDAGYKSEMGAQPGAHLIDLLFVRNALLARLLSPWWERAA